MPFPLKIQPVDSPTPEEQQQQLASASAPRFEPTKPVVKSRLKWFFELPFLKNSAIEKSDEPHSNNKDGLNCSATAGAGAGAGAELFEPSSVCLAKMVQNFIEENSERQPPPNGATAVRCGRNRCNCFNRNGSDSSEDELDNAFGDSNSTVSSSAEACEILKSLVLCASVCERNLLADISKIVDKNNKICKRKEDFCRRLVTDGLVALGYDASICKARWDKSPSCPAGEYEYIDVIVAGGERLLVDIDFRSVFEIARPTKAYKSVLQILPHIFVGKPDRLEKIIALVSEAAKQSLKKKGMHIPPWRKAEYVKAKWLSPHTRATHAVADPDLKKGEEGLIENGEGGELGSSFEEKNNSIEEAESLFALSSESSVEEEKLMVLGEEWKPPGAKPKILQFGVRTVTGLASVMEDER